MEKIIEAVSVNLLKKELTKSKKLTNTNKGNNELYVVTWQDSPNVTTEIGRLRELSFRTAGGSTGHSVDLDEFDKMEHPYKQLIVWDPDFEAILGGFRFLLGTETLFDENGQPILASSHQFEFTRDFIQNYLPHIVELGRLFVAPEYQSSKAGAKCIFALDNLWDGLAAIIMRNPDILYYFGKVTVYPSYDKISRDLLYHYLWKHFADQNHLLRPCPEMEILPESSADLMNLILTSDDVQEDYKLLKNAIRRRGTCIPPNFNAFISITPRLFMCGTAVNRPMHDIEDTALLIPFDNIYDDKKARHIGTYLRYRRAVRRALTNPEEEDRLVNRWLKKRFQSVHNMLTRPNKRQQRRKSRKAKQQ
ncbi:MAG: GNAT family N-acetyltransferase [Paludibacteraceae bacterium]|nr:GNAT family N-acetyltransferase [Paludibacteraceae bacterium]